MLPVMDGTEEISPGEPATAGIAPPLKTRVFVGRTRELAEMRAALDDGASGEGSLFLVSGDAGIGKTLLAREIARTAGPYQFRVLWGRCHEGAGIPPYWPWIQILRGAAGSRSVPPPPDAARLAAQLTADAAPRYAPLPASGFEGDRFWLTSSLVDFFRQISTAKPTLLILDDLQWADILSLVVLEFLAGELASSSLVVVGIFRELEVHIDPNRRHMFGKLARFGHSLPLRGLRRCEVEEHIIRRYGLSLSSEVIQTVCELTCGNPRFIDEILRLLLSEASAGQPQYGSGRHLAVPEGIRAAIRRCLEPLTPQARDVISIAAAMGGEPSLAALEIVTGLSEQAMLELLAHPAIRQIMHPDERAPGHFRFSPPIVAEALYDDLDNVRRVQLQRSIGDALDGLTPARGEHAASETIDHSVLCPPSNARRAVQRRGEPAMQALARALPDPALGGRHITGGPGEIAHQEGDAPRCSLVASKAGVSLQGQPGLLGAIVQSCPTAPPLPTGEPAAAISTPNGSRLGFPHKPAREEVQPPESVFRQEGEYWTIAYAGTTVRLRDTKGFRFLARLLARPQVEVHVADLSCVASDAIHKPGAEAERRRHLQADLTIRRMGDAGQLLDARAKAAYKSRLQDLHEDLQEARDLNNGERAALVKQEIDAITHELASAVGLGGRDRKAASAAERARVNVTRTIRAAIDKIGQVNPTLGQHLSISVKTGAFCSYSPDHEVRHTWCL
jgi:hypothetical protein